MRKKKTEQPELLCYANLVLITAVADVAEDAAVDVEDLSVYEIRGVLFLSLRKALFVVTPRSYRLGGNEKSGK